MELAVSHSVDGADDIMRLLNGANVALTGTALFEELKYLLDSNGDNMASLPTEFVERLHVAAKEFGDFKKNFNDWFDARFRCYLDLFDELGTKAGRQPEGFYSTPMGEITNVFLDIYQP